MTIGVNLRPALTGAVIALALAAPAAQAAKPAPDFGGVYVCNEASQNSVGGDLTVIDPAADPNPPARYKQGLKAHPGRGAGLLNAAEHSPALALCGDGDGSEGGGVIGGGA